VLKIVRLAMKTDVEYSGRTDTGPFREVSRSKSAAYSAQEKETVVGPPRYCPPRHPTHFEL